MHKSNVPEADKPWNAPSRENTKYHGYFHLSSVILMESGYYWLPLVHLILSNEF